MTKVDGLILSAGYSRRMTEFKPLMEYNGIPFLVGILLKMAPHCNSICVVTGYQAEEIQKKLIDWFSTPAKPEWLDSAGISHPDWQTLPSRVSVIFNPEFSHGMLTSLQTGLQTFNSDNWLLYHFVDQPQLPPSFYQEFVQQTDDSFDWIQPKYRNRPGHPLILNPKIFSDILEAESTENLNRISRKFEFRKKFWDCNYREILTDFDTDTDVNSSGESNGNLP